MRNGRIWAEDARLLPGWNRIEKAAQNAITAPETWVPLSGAVLIYATNSDNRISHWAATTNPIFGTQHNADKFSDYSLYFSRMAYYSSVLLTPGGNNTDQWLLSKLKGAAIGFVSTEANVQSVHYLKIEGERLRPDRTDHLSFPSGHTSKAAVHNMLTLRNFENSNFCECAKTGLHIGFSTLTLATAWSRVEANRHYPTDVLVGAAIGNFLGSFIHDAFIGIDHRHEVDINFSTMEDRLIMNLSVKL